VSPSGDQQIAALSNCEPLSPSAYYHSASRPQLRRNLSDDDLRLANVNGSFVLGIGLCVVPSRTITFSLKHALICYVIARRWAFGFLI
jgi:hypothetical protein